MNFFTTLITTITMIASSLVPSGGDMQKEYYDHLNVPYGEYERQIMDIYLPSDSSREKYGAIMFIHGGSWTSGDKSAHTSLCKSYAKKGYITATINYHYVSGESSVWTNMEDISLATKKLSEFSKEKGYPLTSLALHGYSSGAHLATLFSYSCPEKSAVEIKFVVNMAGPADFNSDTWLEWDYDSNTGPGLAYLLYGASNIKRDGIDMEKDAQILIDKVSPIYYINENSVPTICGYAGDGKDGIVPTKNKTLTFQALKKHSVRSDCFSFDNSNHFLISDPQTRSALYDKMDEYCKEYFGY